MSDWAFLNRHRLRRDLGNWLPGTDPSWGFCGCFQFPLAGEPRRINCIASDGMGWQHVSVTYMRNLKPPSWEVMCRVKDLFWDAEEAVIQIHPPRSSYVNDHPGCLHLWRCLEKEQPLPPSLMVGGISRAEAENMVRIFARGCV